MFQDGPIAVVLAKPSSDPSCTVVALLQDLVFLEFPSTTLHRLAIWHEKAPRHPEYSARPFTCLDLAFGLTQN